MTVRRLTVLVGAVILVVGLSGMLLPVSVSDGNGASIGCGNAVAADLSGARSANDKTVANIPILNQVVPHTDYVAQCESSVSSRRAWSIPVTVVGALITVGALVLSGRRGAAANRL